MFYVSHTESDVLLYMLTSHFNGRPAHTCIHPPTQGANQVAVMQYINFCTYRSVGVQLMFTLKWVKSDCHFDRGMVVGYRWANWSIFWNCISPETFPTQTGAEENLESSRSECWKTFVEAKAQTISTPVCVPVDCLAAQDLLKSSLIIDEFRVHTVQRML